MQAVDEKLICNQYWLYIQILIISVLSSVRCNLNLLNFVSCPIVETAFPIYCIQRTFTNSGLFHQREMYHHVCEFTVEVLQLSRDIQFVKSEWICTLSWPAGDAAYQLQIGSVSGDDNQLCLRASRLSDNTCALPLLPFLLPHTHTGSCYCHC